MISRKSIIALLAILLGATLIGPAAPAVRATAGIPERRFGVVESYAAPDAASALGAGWTRVTFQWNQIQPDGPEQWNVTPISDAALNNERARGREVVGLLVTTPGWATDHTIGPGVPRGLDLPLDHPDNVWAQFVRTIVARYAGRIDRWIVGNEPDIPDTYHMSWGGSIEDFVRLLQVAYVVTKETNPQARVHMAAVTHYWDEHWYNRFLDVLTADPQAAANNYYFDVTTLHIYFQTDIVYHITAHYANMMRGRGIHKPIWIAETNAAPSRDPAWPVPDPQFDVSLDQQAAYVIQALSLSIAAGAERVAVYKMADTESDRAANPEPFGLVRMDGSRRPAFTAFRTGATYLAGFRGASWDQRDDVSVVTVDRGDQTTTVVWERRGTPQTAQIEARTDRALLVDMRGSARTIYPQQGYYSVDLTPATCMRGCQIGGPPYMLVEQAPTGGDTLPRPTETPGAPPAEVPTATVGMASPSPSPSPSATASPSRPAPTPSPTQRRPRPTPVPSATPTATATAVPSPTPTLTATATAPPAPSPTTHPSPTPTPQPPLTAAGAGPWILGGVLLLSLAGGAAALARARSRPRDGAVPTDTDSHPQQG